MYVQTIQHILVQSVEASERAKGGRWKGFCCVLRTETRPVALKHSEPGSVALDEVGQVCRDSSQSA